MGRGIGFIGVQLLASVALAAPARLWTRDRRLAAVATALNLVYWRPHWLHDAADRCERAWPDRSKNAIPSALTRPPAGA